MNPVNRPTSSHCRVAWIVFATLVFAAIPPAAGQGLVEFELQVLPLSTGFTSSSARGISERGWEPLTVAGTMANGQDKATCWIRVSQIWSAHELPGLGAKEPSWANGVAHAPGAGGEWTIVVGAAVDGTGTERPMAWNNVHNMPWQPLPLPTLSGGNGEAQGVFLPDGVPVRALVCGWSGENPPMAAEGAAVSRTFQLGVPVIWETTAAGERILRPDFGAGLEGHVASIGSAGIHGFVAFGGGENATGAWMPQMWTSTDDGETWANSELPLPLGAADGEVVDYEYDAQGRLVVSGWDASSTGAKSPLLWERDLNDPQGMWVMHQLPVPASKEGGQNNYVHKLPNRIMSAGDVIDSGGGAELTLWVEDPLGGGWLTYGPADYLSNPQVGTPISPAGYDDRGRITATVETAPPTGSATAFATQPDTIAGLLIPTTPTGVNVPAPSPRRLITVSASPNPFNPAVRIRYTLPRNAEVTVTIHDATGRVVKRLEEGFVPAGEARARFWDGTANDGNRAASGVYFVRVATPYEIASVKVVMVE
jgi:hypothetical protein